MTIHEEPDFSGLDDLSIHDDDIQFGDTLYIEESWDDPRESAAQHKVMAPKQPPVSKPVAWEDEQDEMTFGISKEQADAKLFQHDSEDMIPPAHKPAFRTLSEAKQLDSLGGPYADEGGKQKKGGNLFVARSFGIDYA